MARTRCKQTGRQTLRQADKQTDRQTDGRTDGRADRQTDGIIPIYPKLCLWGDIVCLFTNITILTTKLLTTGCTPIAHIIWMTHT